jgi:hypothetical protein
MARRSRRSTSDGIDLAVIGKYLFLAGVILSVVFGLWPNSPQWGTYVLMAAGFIGGFLYIGKAGEHEFILGVIGLALFSSSAGAVPRLGQYLSLIFDALIFFLGFAVIAVGIRMIIGWVLPE